MNDALIEFIRFVYGFFDITVSSVGEFLTKDILGLNGSSGWADAAEIAIGILKPSAYVIASICFAIELCKLTIQAEFLKWQNIFKCFFLFLMAKAGIDIAGEFMVLIYQMCVEWINGISTGITLYANVAQTMEPMIQSFSFWQCLISFVALLVPLLIIIIVSVAIEVIAMARCFEITVYYAISPIPFAFLPMAESGQAGRIATKFIMSFTAACFQGFLIMLCLLIYKTVSADLFPQTVIESESEFISVCRMGWNQVLCGLLLLFAIIKTGTWASKIFE